MGSAAAFPLVDALSDLMLAYARYFLESRDLRVVIWAALFFLVCLVPAVLLDLLALPGRLLEHEAGKAPHAGRNRG